VPGPRSDLNRVSWDAWAAVHGQDTYYDSAVRGRFDLAYATIGVLCWIDDVGAWMRSVAGVLRPRRATPAHRRAPDGPHGRTGRPARARLPVRQRRAACHGRHRLRLAGGYCVPVLYTLIAERVR